MDDDFTARAGEYWPRLTRTARLLTGNSADADRRARAALAEVYARRGVPGDDAEFYVRRALVRGFLRWRPRLPGRSGTGFGARFGSGFGSGFGTGFGSGSHARRTPWPYVPDPLDPLTEVLAGLPPRRRAVAVLRHWDGLTRREVAALLGSSPGAVKAVERRAEKALRAHAAYRESRPAGSPQFGGPQPGGPSAAGPVPLSAIEQAGRTRRRRRRLTTAALTSAGALLLVPLVVGAVRGTGSGSGGAPVSVAGTAVRVVTPGERVAAAPGVQFWLSKDGTHWSAEGRPNRFRDADEGDGEGKKGDGSLLTAWADPTSGKRLFLSGVHRGTREAARVELTVSDGTSDGTSVARVLTLAGSPGWSAWYLDTQLGGSGVSSQDLTVRAYDAAGKLLARTDAVIRTDTPS
ncbi:sigma factor-like helix-turn-helix DNA-binding protein [Streptomyces beigongshangae]|uniref:sigma factor-like helix-turn-helix DNA-binding protein n=1 Tax=Streptomyces beigongshangae TaxID=2841597 RepID=UPI001C846498|nr:sigma factor-like helix-turn-helix DNA-binding protein [Streptomyces sp. REN17]